MAPKNCEMVVVGGIRYRREDAERLGLLRSPEKPKTDAKKGSAQNKARKALDK